MLEFHILYNSTQHPALEIFTTSGSDSTTRKRQQSSSMEGAGVGHMSFAANGNLG
ncbi:hypothetical protein ACUTAF_09185 [Pseudomonas sp. SP16.1]|uniref:hypothetical protein n=1 Tax=Pseudomonas sp. SP16.1 TaxID=3458854 RepID=UPI004045BBAA